MSFVHFNVFIFLCSVSIFMLIHTRHFKFKMHYFLLAVGNKIYFLQQLTSPVNPSAKSTPKKGSVFDGSYSWGCIILTFVNAMFFSTNDLLLTILMKPKPLRYIALH